MSSKNGKAEIYIVSMKERDDELMDIWSTPFTDREKAEAFVDKVLGKLEEYGMDGKWDISMDVGILDDEMYLDWIDDRYEYLSEGE